MASFDIHSLFPNIPLGETNNICADLVFHKKIKVKGMVKRYFKQLLTLSVNSSCVLFKDVSCEQADGVVIGSPLRPTLTNFF